MATKCFTIDEANALVPRLEMIMERIQRTVRTVRSALQESDDAAGAGVRTTADIARTRPDLAHEVHAVERLVAEIEALGCQFKGVDLGLVDFPTMVDGTVVLLCWQYGEKEIAYWHGADEGFAGRRPLHEAATPHLQ